MYKFGWKNGFVEDSMDGKYILTEEKIEEILIAEGNDIYDEEMAVDSVIVMDLAANYGFQNLGDYGNGCLFLLDPDKCINDLLRHVQ